MAGWGSFCHSIEIFIVLLDCITSTAFTALVVGTDVNFLVIDYTCTSILPESRAWAWIEMGFCSTAMVML